MVFIFMNFGGGGRWWVGPLITMLPLLLSSGLLAAPLQLLSLLVRPACPPGRLPTCLHNCTLHNCTTACFRCNTAFHFVASPSAMLSLLCGRHSIARRWLSTRLPLRFRLLAAL